MSEHSVVQPSIGGGSAGGRHDMLRRFTRLGLGGAALAGSLAVGASQPARSQGYYPPPPPPPYAEGPPPPRNQYFWEAGHWRWNGYKYIWFGGHWIPNGPPGTHFVPGYWANEGGQPVWISGHWKYD